MLIVLFSHCASREIPKEDVPSVVLNALEAELSTVSTVEWEKHNDLYEAETNIDDSTEVTTLIDATGKIVKRKTDIPLKQLGDSLKNIIAARYQKFSIEDVEKVESEGMVYFQVELKQTKGRDLHVVLNINGQEDRSIKYWD